MRKLKKMFFYFILFLFYSNIVNSATKEMYYIEQDNNLKKFLVCIGISLIISVIYLGYKIDKKEELKKRKGNNNKVNYNKRNNTIIKEKKLENLKDIKTPKNKLVTEDTVMINYAKLKKIENEKLEFNNDILKKEDLKIDSTITLNTLNENKKNTINIAQKELNKDLELLELEEFIKTANSKKYTRKK